jgi:hypothetical protein
VQPAPADEEAKYREAVLELYRTSKLLSKRNYSAIRQVTAARIAREYDAEIRRGLGSDYEAMQAWLNGHPEIRDELYIAIDPKADKIADVLRVFNELRKAFPEKLSTYGELGIATAVVWDDHRRGVYHYAGHAARCQAIMPPNLLEAKENFEYLVTAEPIMQGRIQYMPWEYLVHVVDHRTPLIERGWAVNAYLAKRSMFGKCYSDVPYDQLMLRTDDRQARLNGQQYNLPNLLAFGGVCGMQADFAARVGKSLGVAAAYVSGQADSGEPHAWVMWVELKQATPSGLVFTLESHGRYRLDRYYVGHLSDPQTGASITDRELELRLHMTGLDTMAKRQANLAMQAFPIICQAEKLDVSAQLKFLSDVISLAPGCEDAWLTFAKLGRESKGLKQYSKDFGTLFDRLFVTFARVPDFTWKIFDQLSEYQTDFNVRSNLYERLVAMYELAGRPDLACEARLKLSELLVQQSRKGEAIEGLAFTIRRFPNEGRYVPKMLDRMESLCQGVEGADQLLARFYAEILPLVPKYRGDDPSPYAIAMFKRAAVVFARCNQPQLASAALAEVHRLQVSPATLSN